MVEGVRFHLLSTLLFWRDGKPDSEMIGFDVDASNLDRDQILVVGFRGAIAFVSCCPTMLANGGDDQLLDLGSGDATQCGRLVYLSLDEGRRDVIAVPNSGLGYMGGRHPVSATITVNRR
jgi:hypothetical protein